MLKTKTLLVATVLAATALPMCARAVTLEVLVDQQRAAMADEIAKKRAESQAQSALAAAAGNPLPPAAAVLPKAVEESTRSDIEDLSVVAVYGEEGKLKADISVRSGVAASRREGAEVMPGWFIEAINSQYVSFVKGRKRTKSSQRHVVYITEPASNATIQNRGLTPNVGFGGGLPPMPVVPPATGPQGIRR
jgi:type IV pilus biogenesis protein PilP